MNEPNDPRFNHDEPEHTNSNQDEDDVTVRADGGFASTVDTALPVERPSGSWLTQLWVVITTEYRLAIRGRWAIAMTVIFGAFALGLTTFSGSSVSPEGFERTVGSLAVLAVYLIPLIALAFSYDAIVGYEENGWLQSLFALPVQRGRIVIGTFIGRALVFACAVLIGFGIAGWYLLQAFGIAGFTTYLIFMVASVGLGLIFISIGMAISTVVSKSEYSLGLSLLVWAWFVLVHDLLGLGIIAATDLSSTAVSAIVIANPTGVYRALVLGSLGASGDAGLASILTESGLSVEILIAALLLWIFIPVGIATVAIRRRRL